MEEKTVPPPEEMTEYERTQEAIRAAFRVPKEALQARIIAEKQQRKKQGEPGHEAESEWQQRSEDGRG